MTLLSLFTSIFVLLIDIYFLERILERHSYGDYATYGGVNESFEIFSFLPFESFYKQNRSTPFSYLPIKEKRKMIRY